MEFDEINMNLLCSNSMLLFLKLLKQIFYYLIFRYKTIVLLQFIGCTLFIIIMFQQAMKDQNINLDEVNVAHLGTEQEKKTEN